jgi:hypothetical protein
VRDSEVIPQLEELMAEETWRFPPAAEALIRELIEGYRTGRFLP